MRGWPPKCGCRERDPEVETRVKGEQAALRAEDNKEAYPGIPVPRVKCPWGSRLIPHSYLGCPRSSDYNSPPPQPPPRMSA